MKWSCTFNGLIGTTALLLPLTAATESHLQTGAASAGLSSTAQVNFKIIIPKVLYLHVDAQTVAAMSNGHNVCTMGERPALPISAGRLICTASMP
jgi:hypothetical protein